MNTAIIHCGFFESDCGEYLYLKQDGKVVNRWKLPLPKSDSLQQSPNDALAELVAKNSRRGKATVIVE